MVSGVHGLHGLLAQLAVEVGSTRGLGFVTVLSPSMEENHVWEMSSNMIYVIRKIAQLVRMLEWSAISCMTFSFCCCYHVCLYDMDSSTNNYDRVYMHKIH